VRNQKECLRVYLLPFFGKRVLSEITPGLVQEYRVERFNETILEIEVRGKRGVGYCKSMPGAVLPFKRLKRRKKPEPTDLIFPNSMRGLLNIILQEENLKVDHDGNQRTAHSLRHTYVCFRLLEGADIYQVAKNCRTSVEMIEKHYAAHLKNTLDAAAINVRSPGQRGIVRIFVLQRTGRKGIDDVRPVWRNW
jgi:integrase